MSKNRCRKRNFKTKRQALKGLGQVQVLNMSKGQEKKNKHLHVYECDECNAWHIGHKVNKGLTTRACELSFSRLNNSFKRHNDEI